MRLAFIKVNSYYVSQSIWVVVVFLLLALSILVIIYIYDFDLISWANNASLKSSTFISTSMTLFTEQYESNLLYSASMMAIQGDLQ